MTSTEKQSGQSKSHPERWLGLLGAAGFFTFLGSVIGQGVEGYTLLTLERQKYEYSLISEILSDEDIGKQAQSTQLLFLIDIGAVKALDTENLRKQAEEPENLPSLPVVGARVSTSSDGTRLSFQTRNYTVRIFSSNDLLFMNVFNKFTGALEVEGAAANTVPPEGADDQTISYVATGNRQGIPVEYLVNIEPANSGMLEIYNVNGQRLLQEQAIGINIINIPELKLSPDVITPLETSP